MFSLIHKELTERAARRSTHWSRLLNAGLLFVLLLIVESARRSKGQLGGGDSLFALATWTQWGFTMLLVPLSTSSIAAEKERDSWPLLLLTDLRPREIVWQKYGAGLIPALTSVLLLLPVGALCYGAGGLESRDVHLTILALAVTVCQVGAVALFCSTLCETSVTATFLSLAFNAALILLPSSHLSTYHLLSALQHGDHNLTWSFISLLASAVVLLLLAEWRLLRRPVFPLKRWLPWAAKPPSQGLSAMDVRYLHRMPVAWRELTRRSLCQRHHLLWMAVPILSLITIYSVWTVSQSALSPRDTMPVLMGLLWLASGLLLTIQAASMIVKERAEQTLELLLTTPIQAAELVSQKAVALKRMALLSAFTILSGALASVLLRSDLNPWIYLPTVALGTLYYLPATYWLGFIIGSRAHGRVHAIFSTLALFGFVHGLPWLLHSEIGLNRWVYGSCPALAIAGNEIFFSTLAPQITLITLFIHFAIYGGVLLSIHHAALYYADRWLGRPSNSLWTNPEQPFLAEEDPY